MSEADAARNEQHFRFQVLAPGEPYEHQKDWLVRLPHSCDKWVIGQSRDQGEVVRDLRQFIAEAQAALGELRRRIRDVQAPS